VIVSLRNGASTGLEQVPARFAPGRWEVEGNAQ